MQLLGIILGSTMIWIVYTAVSYSFHLVNKSIPVFSGPGIITGLIVIAISTLPYWFTRKGHPELAQGILIGLGATVGITLFLSLFSSM